LKLPSTPAGVLAFRRSKKEILMTTKDLAIQPRIDLLGAAILNFIIVAMIISLCKKAD
jgi:hypothetical protein